MSEMFEKPGKRPAHSKATKDAVAKAHEQDEALLGGENFRVLPAELEFDRALDRELTPSEIRLLEQREQRKFNLAMKAVLADRVRVKFPNTSDLDGRFPVKAGLNGHQFLIRRNVEVDVPRAVLAMLDTREIGVVTQMLNDQKDGLVDAIEEVRRFPYQVIADPAPAKAA